MPNKSHSTIDLNIAGENELVKKLKISNRLAKRIIALRPYQSIEQLNKLWGIDPQILARILPLVSVSQDEAPAEPVIKEISTPSEEIPALPQTESVVVDESQVISKNLAPKEESRFLDRPIMRLFSVAPKKSSETNWKLNLTLALIFLVGAYFRFTGLNWDQGQHQHPDERFITMVANEIRGVDGIAAYFDTEHSSLNPLRFGSYTYGMFPLFFTRMVAEWVQMDDYDNIVFVGRAVSGVFDLLAVWLLYLLGKRLYGDRVGLLAAALGVAAVLPIQLSHYFAVDSFSTVFVVASFYIALLAIPVDLAEAKISRSNLIYFGLFGFVVGLAGACKVNTLPVFGIILLAGVAKIITDWKKPDFRNLLAVTLFGWVIAALFTALAFRIFQPYAFAGPSFLNIKLNERWLEVLKEVVNQVAGNSDWPPNTHWTNRPITYAWINMVSWGMGLPLGLAGWLGWAWAARKMWDGDSNWRRHFLPFIWIAVYFIWQNGQFWRYMRYFLPIYPFIILFAAWILIEIYDRTLESRTQFLSNGTRFAMQFSDWRRTWQGVLGLLIFGIVLGGTFVYAMAFTQIYNHSMTRIAASEWMLENIPGPLNVIVESPNGNHSYPVAVPSRQVVQSGEVMSANIHVIENGKVTKITTTDVRQVGVSFYFRITRDEAGTDLLTEGRFVVNDDNHDNRQEIAFGDIELSADETYYFYYKIQNSSEFSLSNVTLQNADEGKGFLLPLDLNLQSQPPGMLQGSFPIQVGNLLVLNRLKIESFSQVFAPTQTTLKISIYKQDDENLLAETSQTFSFSEPGIHLSPTFDISPLEVAEGQSYQVRYEITDGAPLRLLGEKFTLETSWDDALPLNINKYDVQGGIFTPLNLELYEPDTPEKRESMIRVLSESNYIVLPSNRAYDAMPRLPLRYPMATKFYQALFDCKNCIGDALENRAYGLKPPFKSPLGFELIEVFESPPSLGFLTFSDNAADESFTVYDHPKVFVFKKSQDFSIDYVSALLYSVNLDQVIFQTPKQYTQVPTAMQLPPDRLAAQTNGGTWSDMFDRTLLINNNGLFGGLAWYLVLLLIGLIVFPLVFNIFPGLPDRGYPLIRMAGLILMAWLAWFLGSFKILPFSQWILWLYFGLILILSGTIAYRQRQELAEYFYSHWKHILGMEIIFLALFLFSLSIRLGNPDLWHPWLGGEKPMDFAFFNATLKAVYFPPEHPWFSGHYINYYYYGFILAAIPTKLLGILPSIAFNLILPSWFAMTGLGVFSLGFNLVTALRENPSVGIKPAEETSSLWHSLFNRKIFSKSLPYLTGAFALVFVLLLGNLYEVTVLWKYLPEAAVSGADTSSPFKHAGAFIDGALQVLNGKAELPGDKSRWYFEASRPILHEGPDTPIAEFPYFTFLYADMHPHLLIMPFYALALGWILNLLMQPILRTTWISRIPSLVAAGLIFGVFRPSHTWDFPTFLGLGVLVILWNIWTDRRASIKDAIHNSILYELAFVGLAVVFYWPFTQWFKTEYASVELWQGIRTPLIDYLSVFGLSLFVIFSLLLHDLKIDFQHLASISLRDIFSKRSLQRYLIALVVAYAMSILWFADYQVLAFGFPLLAGIAYFILFDRKLTILRKVTWFLFAVGLSITLFVEVFVLKGDSGRSNMVFRFYNQAWFFFGLATSLAVVSLLDELSQSPRLIKYVWSFILGILILCAASYPLIATGKKMTDRWPNIQSPPHSLDGAAFMLGDAGSPAIYNDADRPLNLGRDYPAIIYMQDHITGSPVFVEGHTEEYRWGSRFSIHTGLPSVVGWSWHVRQHNSLLDGAIVDRRIDEVNNFYNTADPQAAEQFLEKYQVRYIIVGDLERVYYSAEGMSKFTTMIDQGMLKIVFGDNTPQTTTIYEVVNIK